MKTAGSIVPGPSAPLRRRAVPVLLAGAMLLVIVLGALTPNTGALPAQSNCQYGNCTSVSPGSSVPLWQWVAVGAVVAALAIAGLLLLLRHRGRQPPTAQDGDEAAGTEGGADPADPAESGESA